LQDADKQCAFREYKVDRNTGVYHPKVKHENDIRDVECLVNHQHSEQWIYYGEEMAPHQIIDTDDHHD
jgi:hypothetical protein